MPPKPIELPGEGHHGQRHRENVGSLPRHRVPVPQRGKRRLTRASRGALLGASPAPGGTDTSDNRYGRGVLGAVVVGDCWPGPSDLAPSSDLARRGRVHRRIVGWTATSRGAVKLRYLGVEKNHAWLRIRCAAINLRTLINSGLARTDGAWALA